MPPHTSMRFTSKVTSALLDLVLLEATLLSSYSAAFHLSNLSPLRPISRWTVTTGSTRSSSMTMSSRSTESEIEVEEKFALPPDGSWSSVESKLSALGFRPKGNSAVNFTDIYYDRPGPRWTLTPNDCWLRFRGKRIESSNNQAWKGKWQLKIRRRSDSDVGAATAYEEIEGEAALSRAAELVSSFEADIKDSREDNGNSDANDHMFADAPEALSGLKPFAQFETSRSSWVRDDDGNDSIASSEYAGLKVDIDSTDFGYGVGEVEAIVGPNDDMESTRKRIGLLVKEISGKTESSEDVELPALGKLETYLIDRRKDHYDAIMNAGIFKPA